MSFLLLELVGKAASDGDPVGIDFRDCAFYPAYTPNMDANIRVDGSAALVGNFNYIFELFFTNTQP